MDFSSYLTVGFNILVNNSAIINGNTVDCVFNELSNSNRKDYTFIDESDCSIMVRTSDLEATPKSYLGKNVTVNSDTWKIIKVTTGPVTTTFAIVSNHKG